MAVLAEYFSIVYGVWDRTELHVVLVGYDDGESLVSADIGFRNFDIDIRFPDGNRKMLL